jgi:hypothetical protein
MGELGACVVDIHPSPTELNTKQWVGRSMDQIHTKTMDWLTGRSIDGSNTYLNNGGVDGFDRSINEYWIITWLDTVS